MVFVPEEIGLDSPVFPQMDDEFFNEVVIGEEPGKGVVGQTFEGCEVECGLLVI